VVAALAGDRIGFARQDGRAPQTHSGAAPAFILERIGQTPHLTLHGLKDELAARGVKVSHNAVWMFLQREGLRFKKNAARA
jgi:transposase